MPNRVKESTIMTNPTIPPCPVCEQSPDDASESNSLCVFGNVVRPKCDHIRSLDTWASDWLRLCNEYLGRACHELGIETVEQLKTRLAPDPRVAVLEDGIRVALQMCGYKKVGEIESANRYETLDALGLLTQLIAAQRGEG